MMVVEIVEREEWVGFCVREMVVLEVVIVLFIVIVIGGGIILMEFNCYFM